jgi:hypothetical protein
MNNDQDIEQRKKAFAYVLEASSFILKAKGFRIQRVRAVIDALQGAAGGRDEFECSHLNLARRLDVGNEKEVTNEAKIRRVQRLLAVLEAEQKRAGKKAFTVIRGGGFEHKKTKYIDNLTELAVLAVKYTKDRMNKENIQSSRFKIILEEESIKISDLLSDAEKKTADQKENPMPLDDDLYIQRECNHALNSFGRGLARWIKKGGDVESFLQRHHERLRKQAEAITAKAPENAEIKHLEFSETVSLTRSPENEPEAKETPETNMMREALNLAEKGFRIFPVYEPTGKGCSCSQTERCTNAGKHPRILEWQKAASTDAAQIKFWWSKWRGANIGIATGKGSNVIVLDVDANKGGDVSLSELFEDSEIPETLTAKTGNGFHFFFQTVAGVDIRNSVVKIGEGLDIRGENGFVVAVPSLHRNGNRYSWMNEAKPCSMPEFLKEKLIEIERQRTAHANNYKQVNQTSKSEFSNTNTSIIPESTRNETLFRKASALRGNGSNEFEILERLREVNQTQCVPQVEDNELQKIARSVMRYLPNSKNQSPLVNLPATA